MSTAPAPGTGDYWDWSSLREIDTACGLTKGSAFRAFKQRLGDWIEGVDFVVLDPRTHDGISARWHGADRLYRSSINPVLLAPHAAAVLREALLARAG